MLCTKFQLPCRCLRPWNLIFPKELKILQRDVVWPLFFCVFSKSMSFDHPWISNVDKIFFCYWKEYWSWPIIFFYFIKNFLHKTFWEINADKRLLIEIIDPRGRPHQFRPVVITIFTQSVRPSLRPKTSKSSDNHYRPGLWAGREDHWWLLSRIYFKQTINQI